jgi:hypothetical protein
MLILLYVSSATGKSLLQRLASLPLYYVCVRMLILLHVFSATGKSLLQRLASLPLYYVCVRMLILLHVFSATGKSLLQRLASLPFYKDAACPSMVRLVRNYRYADVCSRMLTYAHVC